MIDPRRRNIVNGMIHICAGACKWQKFRLIRQFSANSYVAVLLTSSSATKILEKLPALYSGAVTIGKAISRLIGRIHLSI